MSQYDEDRPSTESIASMGRDDAATSASATTTADDRPTVLHDDEAFDDGQAHAAPGAQPAAAADTDAGGYAGEAAPSIGRPDASDVQLMPAEHAGRLREQWHQVQATFVDDPRGAVSQADTLVAEVMQTLAAGFAEHKRGLEESWQRGEQAGTEDLRVALQSYRAFFDRLLHS